MSCQMFEYRDQMFCLVDQLEKPWAGQYHHFIRIEGHHGLNHEHNHDHHNADHKK